MKLTVRDPKTPVAPADSTLQPSPYWGDEAIWNSQNNVHSPMIDEQGRVWSRRRSGRRDNPAFCQEGSTHPSAKLLPMQTQRAGIWRCTIRRRRS